MRRVGVILDFILDFPTECVVLSSAHAWSGGLRIDILHSRFASKSVEAKLTLCGCRAGRSECKSIVNSRVDIRQPFSLNRATRTVRPGISDDGFLSPVALTTNHNKSAEFVVKRAPH